MPLKNSGWELHIIRSGAQKRAGDGKVRTTGTYQAFHDGVPIAGLAGMTAESVGPGSNTIKGRRIL